MSCWAALLETNSLSFCLSENILISPQFLKDISAECGISGCQVFSSELKYFLRPPYFLMRDQFNVANFFLFLPRVSFCLESSRQKDCDVSQCESLSLSFMKFIELRGGIHSHFFIKSGKFWTLFLQLFFLLFSLSFPSGIPHYTCVRSLNGVTQISQVLPFFFLLSSFCS